MRNRVLAAVVTIALALAQSLSGCGTAQNPPENDSNAAAQTPTAAGKPTMPAHRLVTKAPDHVVIVVEENHSYEEVAKGNAPYIQSLMRSGANLTNYHGVEHPSQPNYLDLFSGADQGVTSDSCPHQLQSPNLGSQLLAAHQTFAGYAEDLPSVGYTGCSNSAFAWLGAGTYARKHSPWVNFTNLPGSVNQPFNRFPTDFTHLPTVCFVIPNLEHDMHNGTVTQGDQWLQQNLSRYASWAQSHNSLLVVTWDEDDQSADNHVPTILVGPMVRGGNVSQQYNHFNLLRTIEDLYGLSPLGHASAVSPIQGFWK